MKGNIMDMKDVRQKTQESRIFGISEICMFFDSNPSKLVAYVAESVARKSSIPAVHLEQLIVKTSFPIILDGTSYRKFPASFVRPASMENIRECLRVAHTLYPAH